MRYVTLKRFHFLIIVVGFLSCKEKAYVEITNITDHSVSDKLITFNKSDFQIDNNQFIVFQDKSGIEVPAQFIDSNEDGKWEEVAILATINGNEKQRYFYKPSDIKGNYSPRTQAYLGLSETRNGTFVSANGHVRPKDHVAQSKPYIYQYEGPGWESDRVAFRTYFDSRNGRDIFGKTTDRMVTNEIGLEDSYHELQEWGMDILKVNNSLGAGALAMLKGDSLYRLGDTERAEVKILENGPIMSQLSLDYDGWVVAGDTYNIRDKISIYAGQRWYLSEVTLENGNDADTLVTGIVNLHDIKGESFEYKGHQVLYSHGVQSYIEDMLGMAVVVPNANFAGFGSAPNVGDGVTYTHTAMLQPSNGTYTYYFYAGWEKENTGFKDKDFFIEQIKVAIDGMTAEVTKEIRQ